MVGASRTGEGLLGLRGAMLADGGARGGAAQAVAGGAGARTGDDVMARMPSVTTSPRMRLSSGRLAWLRLHRPTSDRTPELSREPYKYARMFLPTVTRASAISEGTDVTLARVRFLAGGAG